MGTWSGDDQGSIRTVLIDHDGDSAASDAEGPLAEQKPTTVLDILQERSCIGQVANTWNCPKPTAVAPESPSGCTTPLDAIDPEFEREFDAIISAVSPSAESKTYRGEVYAYVARLLKSQDVCIEVGLSGCWRSTVSIRCAGVRLWLCATRDLPTRWRHRHMRLLYLRDIGHLLLLAAALSLCSPRSGYQRCTTCCSEKLLIRTRRSKSTAIPN